MLPLKLARTVRPNAGIEAAYRKQLKQIIGEMHASIQYWVMAAYRKHPPRAATLVEIAQDASPSQKVRSILNDLARRWIKRFDRLAPDIAASYVTDMYKHTDSAFRSALKDAGWAVEFKMNPTMKDALNASIEENVGLIRSIPQKYLTDVEGIVMRSYATGRDLGTMVTELKALYPQVGNRAALIARDQSNKANAIVNRARSLELGLDEAIWMHSGAGQHPRPSHVKAGKDKKRYKIAEGCYIDGQFIQPGELINCRCTSRVVLPV